MAEVWFKPEGEPFGLAFRIPKESFQISGMVEDLTMENLLKALGIVPEEMESWRQEIASAHDRAAARRQWQGRGGKPGRLSLSWHGD